MRELLASGLLLVLLACASVRVTTWAEPGADFGAFETYAVVPPAEGIPEVRAKIEKEIATLLDARGFRAAPLAVADLVVLFRGSGVSSQRRVLSGDPDTNYYTMESYIQGTLVIDVFDAAGRRRVWHGVGEVDIASSDDLEASAARAVQAVLADFPPPSDPDADAQRDAAERSSPD